jgi:glycosyltransferase involved in cell wall biosynthesis
MKKRIGVITNASAISGVGSRAYELAAHIPPQNDIGVTVVDIMGVKKLTSLPGILGSKSISWIRLASHLPEFDIYDLSNQTLSFIAKRRKPSIVTVHDIIELTDPQDTRARLLNRYLLSGIPRADRIIAVSEYTKQQIIEYVHLSPDNITVIPNGVGTGYIPIPGFSSTLAYQQLLQDYGISSRQPIILHVGSEHPRKNMETVLRTVALLKEHYPDILLLKVGEPGLREGRQKTLEYIDRFNLRQNIKFLGTIPQERMNELYNTANALLFPSTHEGFGLPPLEAMAAGCPAICSNATSLPEIVGDGAIMHDPHDAKAYAKSVVHVLQDPLFRADLISRGIARASMFSWDTSARAMLNVYRELL